MTYVQTAANTIHTALICSPRASATTDQATAPTRAMTVNRTRRDAGIGPRSTTATGGRSGSVRIGSVCVRATMAAPFGLVVEQHRRYARRTSPQPGDRLARPARLPLARCAPD